MFAKAYTRLFKMAARLLVVAFPLLFARGPSMSLHIFLEDDPKVSCMVSQI